MFLKIFEERGELFLGLVEDLRPKWGWRFFPVLVGFQGFGLGELRPRLTRGGTSCRSLLGESDRLWGMISYSHFQARATLGARGKLGEFPLFFVTKTDGVSSVGKGGRLRRGGGRLGELALPGRALGSGDPAYRGTLWAGWYAVSPVPSPGVC
jgi:hypothetical protein